MAYPLVSFALHPVGNSCIIFFLGQTMSIRWFRIFYARRIRVYISISRGRWRSTRQVLHSPLLAKLYIVTCGLPIFPFHGQSHRAAGGCLTILRRYKRYLNLLPGTSSRQNIVWATLVNPIRPYNRDIARLL